MYDESSRNFLACDPIDINCGMLHCFVNDGHDKFKSDKSVDVKYSNIHHSGGIISCYSAVFSRNHQFRNMGMVRDGKQTSLSENFFNQNQLFSLL